MPRILWSPHKTILAQDSSFAGVDAEIAAAALLTAIGGFMDAYAYLTRDGVFANAQTGNVVLLGIYLAAQNWGAAVRHVPPIIAFFIGVTLTHLFLVQGQRHRIMICLLIECIGLVALGLLGHRLPGLFATTAIGLLAAMQSASFSTVKGWSYNSAMTTGNLRATARAFSAVLAGKDPARNGRGARLLGLMCVSFLIGALAGGLLVHVFADQAILFAAAGVVLVAFLVRRS